MAVDDAGFGWVAGFSTPENKVAVWRVSPAGELADGFPILRNNDGGNPAIPRSEGADVAIAPNGDAVVVGRSYNGQERWVATVWRFAPDGTLRQTFPRFGPNDTAGYGVTVDDDGFIWMVGTRSDGNEDLVVWRFDDQGALSADFPVYRGDIIGQERFNWGFDVVVDGNGIAWVAGWSRWDGRHPLATVWAYRSDGQMARQPWSWPGDVDEFQSGVFDLAVGADGSIWAAGRTQRPGDPESMSLFKFHPGGALLEGFPVSRAGDAGGAGNHGAYGVAAAPDGGVWAAGYGSGPASFEMLLWRTDSAGVTADGYPIIRADDAGVVSTDLGYDVAAGPDGAVWVTGQSRHPDRRDDMILWRFQ